MVPAVPSNLSTHNDTQKKYDTCRDLVQLKSEICEQARKQASMNIPPPSTHLQLPPGWITANDPISGNVYYANPGTGETSWQPPAAAAIIPPPPPPPPLRLPPPSQHHIPQNGSSSIFPKHEASIIASGLLVPAARFVLNEHNSLENQNSMQGGNSNETTVELKMKAGMIADLANVQSKYRRDQSDDEVNTCYEPLKLFDLPLGAFIDPIAEGRLDVRLVSLMDSLANLESTKS